jgi:hypothetical protein
MTVIALFLFPARRRRKRGEESAYTPCPTAANIFRPSRAVVDNTFKNFFYFLYMEAFGLACIWVLTGT